MKIVKVNEKEYFKAILRLSEKIKTLDFDILVGILRGGAAVSIYLSYLLDKPVCTVSPDDVVYFDDRKVLIIDDIYDTGSTIHKMLRNVSAKEKNFAVLISKKPEETPIYVMYVPFGTWVEFWYDRDKDSISQVKRHGGIR